MQQSDRFFFCWHQIAHLPVVENLIQKAWVQILAGTSLFLPSNITHVLVHVFFLKLVHLQTLVI